MSLTIDIEPLSPVLGAAIRGIDFSRSVDDRTVAAMLDAFHKYSVLCFPGQKIS